MNHLKKKKIQNIFMRSNDKYAIISRFKIGHVQNYNLWLMFRLRHFNYHSSNYEEGSMLHSKNTMIS